MQSTQREEKYVRFQRVHIHQGRKRPLDTPERKIESETPSETHSDDGKVTRKGYLVYYYKKMRKR